ncbi:hypothetical protein LTS18_006227 [Coniosporium uncinatum]|uniref:Uncharacterized protein n=1 Tax=Coniosporium uncinatum TaxID=93489 RepID=A0ACC3DDN1_9PEZI|nr:hypothetical protein LTS18_006227 [Coniosporium uncinatum]
MSASSLSNNDLDPASFVQRIQELGRQRDQEDAERFRVLEAEIQERRARREERARSLSPQKSPSHAASTRTSTPIVDEPSDEKATKSDLPSISSQDARKDAFDKLNGSSNTMSDEPPKSAVALARSGTLSWQQRPGSRQGSRPGSRPASRPLSRVESPAPPRPTQTPTQEDNAERSRSDIAQSLGSKDPSWFKQTPDRGIGSAAYRRNQEEEVSVPGSAAGRFKLHGLSQGTSGEAEPAISPPPESERSESPTRAGSFRGSSAFSNRFSNVTSTSGFSALEGKPVLSPRDSQRFSAAVNDPAFLPTERPASPTKGAGGFVQSAMMKRTDSVNKRWSAQVGPGVSRQDSTASTRSGLGISQSSSTSRLEGSKPTSSLSRDNSLEPNSRPSSSYSNQTTTQSDKTAADDEFVKPALPHHSRSKSVASLYVSNEERPKTPEHSLSHSPSKKWSPTKSSWLESALSRPESPKPKTAASTQPSWMADLKAKQRGSVFETESTSQLAAKPATKLEEKQLPRLKSSSDHADLPRQVEPAQMSKPPVSARKPSVPDLAPLSSRTPDIASTTTPKSTASTLLKSSPAPVAKSKPETPPKKDFRANLKPRHAASDADQKSEPEFKDALGKLKRAQTEKYQAPDLLKDNILRGKAGLSLTGGPKKTERVDELKESILKRKEAMKAKVGEGAPPIGRKPSDTASEQAIPEALVKRQALGRGDSNRSAISPLSKFGPPSTPEALSKRNLVPDKPKPSPPLRSSSATLSQQSAKTAKAAETSRDLPKTENSTSTNSVLAPASTASSEAKAPLKTTEPAKADVLDSVTQKTPGVNTEMSDLAVQSASPTALRNDMPEEPSTLTSTNSKPALSGKLAGRFNPALASMLARGPSPANNNASNAKGTSAPSQPSILSDEPPAAGTTKELTHMTKGRARGPKRRAPGAKAEEQQVTENVEAKASDRRPSPPSKLTPSPTASKHGRIPSVSLVRERHVLGSNAPYQPEQAPRPAASLEQARKVSAPIKAPKPIPLDLAKSRPAEKAEAVKPTQELSQPADESTSSLDDMLRDLEGADKAPLKPRVSQHPPAKDEAGLVASPKPLAVKKSPFMAEESMSSPKPLAFRKVHSPEKDMAAQLQPSKADTAALVKTDEHPRSPIKETMPASGSVKNTAAMFGRPAESTSSPARVKSPIKLPSRSDEESAKENAGLVRESGPQKEPIGLGIGLSSKHAPQSNGLRPLPEPPQSKFQETRQSVQYPMSPPLSAGLYPKPAIKASPILTTEASSSKPEQSQRLSRTLKAPPESPAPHTSEAAKLFEDFFETAPRMEGGVDIDTPSIINSYPLDGSTVGKSKSKTVQEITRDGKIVSLPPGQEHILYEDSVYVCTHTYEDTTTHRPTTSVSLWHGHVVPRSSLEDAQLFARKPVREAGAKCLTLIPQGKEPPSFFQALEGILITLRGSRPAFGGSVSRDFMLCCRSHLGHIVFDEVDFNLRSFNSGFAYIVSARNKLFLWKGAGCTVDELSCARIFAMQDAPTLGISADLEEIVEGAEPAAFLDAFPQPEKGGKKIFPTAEFWKLRPKCGRRYRVRLFRVHDDDDGNGGDDNKEVSDSNNSNSTISLWPPRLGRRPSWQDISSGALALISASSSPSTSPTRFSFEQMSTPVRMPSRGRDGPGKEEKEKRTKVTETAPFSQQDLEAEGVFVLDAFFEIYIILTPSSSRHPIAFTTALLFAQDYGILAASLEDRPFVPVSTVVVEGTPRDMKACFRRWEDRSDKAGVVVKNVGAGTRGVGGGQGDGGLKRGRSLRVVGLGEAIAAVNR